MIDSNASENKEYRQLAETIKNELQKDFPKMAFFVRYSPRTPGSTRTSDTHYILWMRKVWGVPVPIGIKIIVFLRHGPYQLSISVSGEVHDKVTSILAKEHNKRASQ